MADWLKSLDGKKEEKQHSLLQEALEDLDK